EAVQVRSGLPPPRIQAVCVRLSRGSGSSTTRSSRRCHQRDQVGRVPVLRAFYTGHSVGGQMKRPVLVDLVLALAIGAAVGAQSRSGHIRSWWNAGSGERFAALSTYDNANGAVAVLNADGAFDTKGHPSSEPLGPNGRACVPCHQPSSGMSLSIEGVRERWNATQGRDPLFAAIDGANCPSLPQSAASSHSLLLDRGLIGVALSSPPVAADGSTIPPESPIEIVRDQNTCNTDPAYGLRSATARVSVFRRPRVAANLKYLATRARPLHIIH